MYRGSARFLHLGGPKLGIMGTKWSPVISPDRVCWRQSLPEAEALLLSACLIHAPRVNLYVFICTFKIHCI